VGDPFPRWAAAKKGRSDTSVAPESRAAGLKSCVPRTGEGRPYNATPGPWAVETEGMRRISTLGVPAKRQEPPGAHRGTTPFRCALPRGSARPGAGRTVSPGRQRTGLRWRGAV